MVPYNSGRCFSHHRLRKGHLLASTLWCCSIALFWPIQVTEASSSVALDEGRRVGHVRYVVLETYGDHGDAWNVFCFPGANSSTTVSSAEQQVCCSALRRALGQPPRDDGFLTLKEDESTETVYEKCLKEVTSFPDPSSSLLQQHTGALVPSFAFFLGRSNLDEISHQQSANREHTSRWRRFLPPPVPSLSVVSNRYVWHNERDPWLHPSTTVVVGPDDSNDDDDAVRAAFWQDWRAEQPGQDDTTHPAGGWTAHLQSKLSSSGGMHRDLHHCITVESTGDEHGQISNSSTAARLSFLMVLQIPAGVFVNVEDLFRIETADVSVQLIGPMERVIDQEEPAFVSPPHGLLVHITVEIQPAKFSTLVVDFFTLLHVRYPLPFSRDEPTASSFRLVVVPPPRLLDGRILHNDDDDGSPDATVRIVVSRRGHGTPSEAEDHRPRLLSLWVAAGREEDYHFTLGVTLLVALLGAMVMLRDISQLAKWD